MNLTGVFSKGKETSNSGEGGERKGGREESNFSWVKCPSIIFAVGASMTDVSPTISRNRPTVNRS